MNTRHDSLFAAYGAISVEDNAVATAVAGNSTDFSAKELVDVFAVNHPALNLTPDQANDKLVIDKRGDYLLRVEMDLQAAAADALSGAIFVNGTQVGPRFSVVSGVGTPAHGAAEVTVALSRGDDVEVYVQNETQTADITVVNASLVALLVKYAPGR